MKDLPNKFDTNPFTLGIKENEISDLFVERDTISQHLKFLNMSFTSSISELENFLVMGDKGMGKTTLLNYIKSKFSEHIYPIWIDKFPTTSFKAQKLIINKLYENVGYYDIPASSSQTLERLMEEGRKAKLSNIGEIFGKIVSMITKVSEKRIVFFVDESSALGAKSSSGRDLRSFLCNFLFNPSISFIFSILPAPFHAIEDEPVRDRFTMVAILPPFDRDEITELIHKRVVCASTDGGLEKPYPLTEDTLDSVMDICEGNPRKTIKLLKFAFRCGVSDNQTHISTKHINEAIPMAFPEYSEPYKPIISHLSPLRKKIVELVATEEEKLPSIQIANKLNKHQSMISKYLNQLVEDDYLVKEKEGRHIYYTLPDKFKTYV